MFSVARFCRAQLRSDDNARLERPPIPRTTPRSAAFPGRSARHGVLAPARVSCCTGCWKTPCARSSREQGYLEVRTPQLLRRPVWEASGHWQHFQGGMFRPMDGSERSGAQAGELPGARVSGAARPPSYRELPIRLAELGVVHRDEPSGTLHGLLRLRQFTQDDGHIFCEPEQAEDEVEALLPRVSARSTRASASIERRARALDSARDERAGDDAFLGPRRGRAPKRAARAWESRTRSSRAAGAFYGPKLEFVLRDRHGRDWQCGTIQFDLVMPPRFDLRYVDAGGERRHPVMLHRALYGSLERFLGMLLEHHGAGAAGLAVSDTGAGDPGRGSARSLGRGRGRSAARRWPARGGRLSPRNTGQAHRRSPRRRGAVRSRDRRARSRGTLGSRFARASGKLPATSNPITRDLARECASPFGPELH